MTCDSVPYSSEDLVLQSSGRRYLWMYLYTKGPWDRRFRCSDKLQTIDNREA